eukprot:1359335-Amphidinium_carterae.1
MPAWSGSPKSCGALAFMGVAHQIMCTTAPCQAIENADGTDTQDSLAVGLLLSGIDEEYVAPDSRPPQRCNAGLPRVCGLGDRGFGLRRTSEIKMCQTCTAQTVLQATSSTLDPQTRGSQLDLAQW